MKKYLAMATATLAFAALAAVSASPAMAFPNRSNACTGCHDGANVPVSATLAANSATAATYNVSAPGADYIAVFNGSTKVSQITGATGQISVPFGSTYTLYSVRGPGTGDGLGSTTVSPAAPVVDATAPVTTSDAVANYTSSATIHLAATDAGSGVANTYYKLDGGPQTAGTSVVVTALGNHTIEFWSVDVAGNIETHKTASFVVNAPAPGDTTAPSTTSDAVATYTSKATIHMSATDAGSGVANTYYRLDGGAQKTGTSVVVTAVGNHTLEFWSVDVAGNIETHKTASFEIVAATPDPTPDPIIKPLPAFTKVVMQVKYRGRALRNATVVFYHKDTKAKFVRRTNANGFVILKTLPTGNYKMSVKYNGKYRVVRNYRLGKKYYRLNYKVYSVRR